MKLRFVFLFSVLLVALGFTAIALIAARAANAAGEVEVENAQLEIAKPIQFPDNSPAQTHFLLSGSPLPDDYPYGGSGSPLHPEAYGDWDGTRVSHPRVISDTGQYLMWYQGTNDEVNPGYGSLLGLAYSADGTSWTKEPANPVLGPGDEGEWDSMYRGQPAFLKEDSVYKMWYSGSDGGPWQTGYATSTNGIDWNIFPGNPVLPVGDPGSWDEQEADGPVVINDGGTYKMWYHGCNVDYSACSIGYAESPDGMSWIKINNNPVLTGTTGAWDEQVLWPVVIEDGGVFEMWYYGCAADSSACGVGYATSPNGENWSKYAGNPILTEGWDGGGVRGISILLEESTYKMWLTSGSGASLGIGYAESSDGINWDMYPGNPVLLPGAPNFFIQVNYAHDWVEIFTSPDIVVTITLANEGGIYATFIGVTNDWGWLGTHQGDWYPQHPNIQPSEIVTATAATQTTYINPIGAVDAVLDVDADLVTGTIHAPWFAPQNLAVSCEIWEEFGVGIWVDQVPADGGSFSCDFSGMWDLQRGHMVAVRYFEPDGDNVINVFRLLPNELHMNINYGHDWIEGEYEPGHTLWITVTESDGVTVKGTATLETGFVPWWGGGTGFSTNWHGWTTLQPDIAPGDWVYGLVDNDYSSFAQVGIIEGVLDIDADTVQGNVYAPWFTETLQGNCGVWEEGGVGEDFQVEPDGGGYFCDFGAMGFDLLPGHMVGVQYQEPDGDWIINVFQEPAPNVRIEKWTEGSGQSAPGGPLVFTIFYRNDGDGVAETIRITDTLPVSTSYVTDSSGVTPDFGPGWVAWTLGPLEPWSEARFQLVLTNTANPGDWLNNMVDIYTLYDRDPWNNHAEAAVLIVEGDTGLNVWKRPNPGDPAPGQTFLYEINYGNGGPVASGSVVLTDTLPEDTTIVSWFSDNGYNLWSEHSTADQFILHAPSIPGHWGDVIRLRLRVDDQVQPGTQLTNTVEIFTANDDNPDDNWHQDNSAWTNWPRWDGHLDKWFNWGILVPGGEVGFNLSFGNNGNMATQAWVTDTLPDGFTFSEAWLWGQPFPPAVIGDGFVAWDMGVLEPGEWRHLDVRLDIGNSIPANTAFTNCATIGIDGEDGWLENNTSCVSDTLRPPGANIRVQKWYNWRWQGQLEYHIRVENLGTQWLQPLWVTDTYPISTTFNWDWWGGGTWITLTHEPDSRQLIFWLDQMGPGWSSDLNFVVDLDGEIIGQQGLAFTNQVEAPIPADIYPADNQFEVTAYTGPDIYVEKWLSGGAPRPGEVVTFTIQFGNHNLWPWDSGPESVITDVLPAEMTFITATAPWDPNQSWMPNLLPGNVLEWGWGTVWNNNWWRFDLVVQISDTVEGGDVLHNVIEMQSRDPNDIDPLPDNNIFSLPVTILNPKYEIFKEVAGSHIAGTPVTYNLTFTNTGTLEGSDLLVTDHLPENLAYLSGGSYDNQSGVISWQVESLGIGQSGSVQFSGEVACTAGLLVSNHTYRVASSGEGVASPFGPLVNFDILAPMMEALFEQSVVTVLPGQAVEFNSTSTTNGSALVSWEWDFGDGASGSGETASHIYLQPGVYDVALTITDGCGFTQQITIQDAVTVLEYKLVLPLVYRDIPRATR